ncbi:MAG: hypothetical protein EA425_04960 [Puniceicoccaceae bacterium]|nr:MAG: hypothetical protein EA425_04960 [Puniceicoccaceae bacterium]
MIDLPEDISRVECPEPVEGLCFVYILICRNGSFYGGQTQNVRARLARHMAGTGARQTRQIKTFSLVSTEGPMPSEGAVQRSTLPSTTRLQLIHPCSMVSPSSEPASDAY